jgi:hypothetical protein
MSTVSFNNQIQDRMEVVCSKGMHLGTVDHVEGDQIKLTKRDSEDGLHHLIPASLVCSVDTKVHLTKSCDEVKKVWQSV